MRRIDENSHLCNGQNRVGLHVALYGKINVKSALCLIKHHATKLYGGLEV